MLEMIMEARQVESKEPNVEDPKPAIFECRRKRRDVNFVGKDRRQSRDVFMNSDWWLKVSYCEE